MNVLVTGGTGFIGNHITKKLVKLGHNVIITGNKTEQYIPETKLLVPGLLGIDWSQIKNLDILFHQAAENDTLCKYDEAIFANYTASKELFTRCLNVGCKHFIYASSCSVYGNQPTPYVENITKLDPLNPYAISKILFEQFSESFSKEFKVNVVGLRYSNVYGPGEKHKNKRASMIYQLLHTMLEGKRPKIFKNGEQLRDWVYIDDVVNANMLASKYQGFEIFNIGSGFATSFNDVVFAINCEIGTLLTPEYIDCTFLDTYQSHTLVDLTKSKNNLKYSPQYNPYEGIKKLIQIKKTEGC